MNKFWNVTTEGDCEGKTINNLGNYYGNIEDIAFSLASKCFYTLEFKEVKPTIFTFLNSTIKSVNVRIYDDYKLLGLDEINKLLVRNNIRVKKSNYYGAYDLEISNYDDIIKRGALSKLTSEERRVLGV